MEQVCLQTELLEVVWYSCTEAGYRVEELQVHGLVVVPTNLAAVAAAVVFVVTAVENQSYRLEEENQGEWMAVMVQVVVETYQTVTCQQ